MKTIIDKAGQVVIPAVRLVLRIPGPELAQAGKRLVAHPTANPEDHTPVDVAKLIEQERDRWLW